MAEQETRTQMPATSASAADPTPAADPSPRTEESRTRAAVPDPQEHDAEHAPADSLGRSAPHPLPQESHAFSQSLARLERNSRQAKLYLDSIEEKIARMEPRLDEMRPSAATSPQSSAATSATLLAATPEVAQSSASVPPLIDRRRRRNDVPEERRRSLFDTPVVRELEDPWSLGPWLRAHRRWAPVALLGPIALAGLLFWNPRPRPTPALPASTPASASSLASPATPKTSAGVPLDASASSTGIADASTAGIRDTPANTAAEEPPPPTTAGTPAAQTALTSNPDAFATTPNRTTDRSASSDPLTGRPESSAISPSLNRSTRGSALPAPGKLHVSSGVMAANLISSRPPVYPGGLAGIFHIEGTVLLQAIIARNGRVVNLRVISGHRMLRSAAKDAVSTWRYRPYTVNGNPVEVATIVSVDFHR